MLGKAHRILRIALTGVSCLLLFNLTFAQSAFPPPIDWLTQEPVSLFDWGMSHANDAANRAFERLKIEQTRDIAAADRAKASGIKPLRSNPFGEMSLGFAWVDWDAGIGGPLIGMQVLTDGGPAPNDAQCAAMLDEFHSRVFAAAGISYYPYDPVVIPGKASPKVDVAAQEKNMRDGAVLAFSRWFGHANYANTSQPRGIPEYLAAHSQIHIRVYTYATDYLDNTLLSCWRPFASRSTTITKKLRN